MVVLYCHSAISDAARRAEEPWSEVPRAAANDTTEYFLLSI